MTVLAAIQSAARAVRVSVPPSLSSAEETVNNLRQLAQIAGEDIARRADWARMVRTADVTLGALPVDYLRLVPGGAVNITAPFPAPVRGPLSSDQLAAMVRMGATSLLFYALSGDVLVYSRALTGETVQATYVSRNWLINGATRKAVIEQDADDTLFPEVLLIKAIIWRFLRQIGSPFQDELAEFEADLALEIKQNRGVTV